MDSIPQKQCTNPECQQWFPATLEYFSSRRKKYPDGLSKQCRLCTNVTRRKHWAKHRTTSKPLNGKAPDGFKRCPECQAVKPATTDYFDEHKIVRAGRYQLYTRCIICRDRETQRKVSVQARLKIEKPCTKCGKVFPTTEEFFYREGPTLRADCKECSDKRAEDYRGANHEHILQRKRDYDKAHPEQHRKDSKQYRQRHPEKDTAHRHKRRAQKRGNGGSYTSEDIQAQLKRQKGKCYYAACGYAKFEKKGGKYIYHVDHLIPISRGGSNDMSNIVLACPPCNMEKHDKLLSEWSRGGRLL